MEAPVNRGSGSAMAVFMSICLLSACGTVSEPRNAVDDARKPKAADSMRAIIVQTAAVVEGTVTDIRFEYDEQRGPRTIATLSSLRVHLGSVDEGSSVIMLDSFGGRLPSGKTMGEAHVPTFGRGHRVLAFLRNTDWFFSPVVGSMAFRVVTVAGKNVVVTGTGATVTGIDRTGPRIGALVLPLNPDGTWPESAPPEVTSATVATALDAEQLVAAVRKFSSETGLAVRGRFSAVPVSNRPRWDVFPVTRAASVPQSDRGQACLPTALPGGDSDDPEGRARTATCVDGSSTGPLRGTPGARTTADEAFVLRTVDGRQWRGGIARIEVYGPLSGRPAIAKVSFAVSDIAGMRLGVYAEVSPSALLEATAQVRIDGKSRTTPGLGVISYGTPRKPVIVESGHLAVTIRDGKFSGSLVTDEMALRSATFEGAYTVECLVSATALGVPANGSLSNGEILASDEEFATEFCRAFKKV